jgi:hypothetical protein
MKKYHRKTLIPRPNIDVHSLWNNIDTNSKNDTFPRWKPYTSTDVWDEETYKKLNDLGFFIKSIRVFRWRPAKIFEWHIDGTINQVEHFAVNWVVEGRGLVQWNPNITLNTFASHGFSRGVSDVLVSSIKDHVEEQTDGDQCILDISTPHRVINLSKDHRMTISVSFKNNLTYSDAVSILDANNLIVD